MKNAKEAVLKYARQIDELEKEKAQAKLDLISSLKESLDTESTNFIDWYYWETDYSTEILCEIMGINKANFAKRITKPKSIPYPCPRCKETNYCLCNNRSEAKLLFSPSHLKFKKDDYICQKCKDIEAKRQEEKNRKIANANKERKKKKIAFLQSMPYEDFLETPYWKKFSQEQRRAAGYKCKKCKRDDLTLQVHHLTYKRRGCELPTDVIVLCEACHKEAHGRPVPQYMIKNPISLHDRALKAVGRL